MSSIGEGIDFSQEQQKISGIVPSSHFPRGTQTFGSFLAQVFSSGPEDRHLVGEGGQRQPTPRSCSSEPHVSIWLTKLLF